jgi:cell division protein FtsL
MVKNMAQYDNLAYDFSRFDREAKQRKQAEAIAAAKKKTIHADFTPKPVEKPTVKTQISEIRGLDTSISRLRMSKIAKVFTACIVLMVMFGVVVYNQAKLTEINREITQTTAKIEQLKTDYQQKSRELEERVNIRTAEDVAKNEYGMTPINTEQVNYITLPGEEAATGVRSDNGLFSSIGRFFTQIAAYISGN